MFTARRVATALGVALFLVSLQGCAASGTAAPAESPTSAAADVPAEGLMYGSVDELRAAFESAGGDCSAWVQANQVTAATESGNCDDFTVLSTYASTRDRDTVVEGISEYADIIGMHLLVGANWIVNSPDVAEFRESLGGTLIVKDPDAE